MSKRARKEPVWVAVPVVRARKGHHRPLMDRLARAGLEKVRADGGLFDLDPPPKLERYSEHDLDAVVERVAWKSSKKDVRRVVGQALDLASSMAVRSTAGAGVGTLVVFSASSKKSRASARDLVLSTTRSCPSCGRGFEVPDPLLLSFNSRRGACHKCGGMGVITKFSKRVDPEELAESVPTSPKRRRRGRRRRKKARVADDVSRSADAPQDPQVCPACGGARLRPEARAVKIGEVSLPEVMATPAAEAVDVVRGLKPKGPGSQRAAEIVGEAASRVEALHRLGLGYLTLDRRAGTLSSGEAQRVRLAALLGSPLSGACYVLDEPTVGLHPGDVGRMVAALRTMTRRGCTVVVVEHDEETIRACDHVLDLGPGAGKLGGKVVAQGSISAVKKSNNSVTGKALKAAEAKRRRRRRGGKKETTKKETTEKETTEKAGGPAAEQIDIPKLTLIGARRHNLEDVEVSFEMGALNAVTGVSGSGKSSLVMDVLAQAVAARTSKKGSQELAWAREISWDAPLEGVKIVTSAPIGHTTRSVPATYLGVFTSIRQLMAGRPEARVKGLRASHFSFNVAGGRCEACGGQGAVKVEMKFLPDVLVPCDDCEGRRYKIEVLDVRYRGYDISAILDLSVEEAAELFAGVSKIRRPLELLVELGLGYLPLGQPSPTLSGGEAQRLRLASEIAQTSARRSLRLYLLDEPTTGLHMADVERLNDSLRRLADEGHTVVVIEHNLDVIGACDHVVDLGPGGGRHGGQVVATGTPEQVATTTTTTTATHLKKSLGL